MSALRSSMSALWNSLTNSAQVVCNVFTSATPVVTANCWTASRTSLVMSEISVRSAGDSVKQVHHTCMDVLSPLVYGSELAGLDQRRCPGKAVLDRHKSQ